MTAKKFTTETREILTLKDFSNVRNLYMPIIGMKATCLYQILADYNDLNKMKRTFFDFKDLQNTLKISFEDLRDARMTLEAVGLLRTYEKANNNFFIININKPLSPTAFRNNSLLYKQYLKFAGEEIFERYEFSNKDFINNKDEYQETTMKFQDMFDINFQLKQNTIEIKLPDSINKDEAIKGLTTMQFVKFLTNKKISPALMSVVQDLQKVGFSSNSINEISSYSFDVNGKIVARHVKSIGSDLFEKNITSSDEVKIELSHALEARNPGVTPFMEEQSSKTKQQQEPEWDDIFSNLGDL